MNYITIFQALTFLIGSFYFFTGMCDIKDEEVEQRIWVGLIFLMACLIMWRLF